MARFPLRKILLATLAAGTVFLSACAASVNVIERTGAQDRRIVSDAKTLEMATPLEIRTGTVSDNVMCVQLELMNHTSEIGRVFCLVEWFDEQGMKMDVPVAWRQLNIQPSKIESIKAVAPNAAARDFRISLKRSE
jgi:uncharacterized protein YcfL